MVLALFPLLGLGREGEEKLEFFAEEKQQLQPGSWWRGWSRGIIQDLSGLRQQWFPSQREQCPLELSSTLGAEMSEELIN